MLLKTHVLHTINEIEFFFDNESFTPDLEFPFSLSKEWLVNWLKYYISIRDKIYFIYHTHEDRVVALFPLYLKKILYKYELRFIGSGENECEEVCSEFQDFIISPNYQSHSLFKLSDHIRQLSNISSISFEKILKNSICYSWLKSIKEPTQLTSESNAGYRYLMNVSSTVEKQIQLLRQQTLRRQARRFLENKNITVHYYTEKDNVDNFFDLLIDLHQKQWNEKNKKGAFNSEKFCDFHRTYAKGMLKQNKLLAFSIQYENEKIAAYYGFYHDDILYYYQSGIKKIDVISNNGIAMHLIALAKARKSNCKFYDLMTAKKNSYKKNYTEHGELVVNIKKINILLWLLEFITRARHFKTI